MPVKVVKRGSKDDPRVIAEKEAEKAAKAAQKASDSDKKED